MKGILMILPNNYIRRMQELLKEEWEAYRATLEMPYYHGLRINDLKLDAPSFTQMAPFHLRSSDNLADEAYALEPIPWVQNGFYYGLNNNFEQKQEQYKNNNIKSIQPAKHPYYHAGLYYIQEPSVMVPAAVLPINENDKVLDLCAAPGGKTTQLGARLGNTGLLVSNDISVSRAKAIVKNIELFGIQNAVVLSETPQKLEKIFKDYFDKILVDAPCSGEGMFRKDPSIIKNWEKTGVEYYTQLQREILSSATQMLRPGGYMVYSTCSFSEEENEHIIQWLLHTYPDFSMVPINLYAGFSDGHNGLEACKRLWPHKLKGEGHFVALLRKNGKDKKERKFSINKFEKPTEKQLAPYLKFESEVLTEPLDKSYMHLIKVKLYLLPKDMPDIKGLRVLRSGWYLGEIEKGRFEPSQAFANGLTARDVKKTIHLTSDMTEVISYLKGETLNLEADEGYHLICVDGFPLGWAKKTGNILKNKYCASWRWQ